MSLDTTLRDRPTTPDLAPILPRNSSEGVAPQSPAEFRGPQGTLPISPWPTVRESGDHWGNSALTPGNRFGDFELLERLGEGAMGVIFRARQRSLNRDVALKMVLTGRLANSTELQRFHLEAEAVARLDHPNIVPIYETGEYQGLHFFAMKLIEGGRLNNIIPELSKNPKQAVELMIRVANAVDFAHQHGIIHRDLKPENILIDERGQPMVTDFGLAKQIGDESSITQSGAIVGSPSYMSPEQALGHNKSVTTVSDVYSLGAILYELLCVAPPFRGDTVMSTLTQVMTRDPEPMRPRNPLVDRDLETICMKCLEKNPLRRYVSAKAFAEDCERWLDGRPIMARPLTFFGRSVKWTKRRPALAAMLVLTSAASASLVTLSVVFNFELQKELAYSRQVEVDLGRSLEEIKRQRDRATSLQHESARNEYVADMNLARLSWEDAQPSKVREILAKHAKAGSADQEDFRDLEWYYLHWISEYGYTLLGTHDVASRDSAFSPDGTLLATAGFDGWIVLWDMKTRKEIHRFMAHPRVINRIAFHPDGRRIATGSGDKVARIYDVQTGELMSQLDGHGDTVFSVAFSPDGQYLATASADRTVKLWDAESGAFVREFVGHTNWVMGLAFDPRGQTLVSCANDKTIRVWDIASGKQIKVLEKHGGAVTDICFRADGAVLASSSEDWTVKLWDTSSWKDIQTLIGHKHWVREVAFQPDGKRLISSDSARLIKIWDLRDPREPLTIRGHDAWIAGLSLSPDGRTLVSCSGDRTVKLWDAAELQEPPTLQGGAMFLGINKVKYSQDDNFLYTAGENGNLGRWDGATGNLLVLNRESEDPLTTLATDPHNPRVATGSKKGQIVLWNAETLETVAERRLPQEPYITELKYHPNEPWFITSDFLGRVFRWDAQTLELLEELPKLSGPVIDAVFRSDGAELFVILENGELSRWSFRDEPNARGWKTVTTFPNERPWCLTLSPDNTTLAVGLESRAIVLYHQESRKTLWLRGHNDKVVDVLFSRNGKRLISAGYDRTFRIWETETGTETLTTQCHSHWCTSLDLRHDGRTLATSSVDNTVKLWTIFDPVTPASSSELPALGESTQ